MNQTEDTRTPSDPPGPEQVATDRDEDVLEEARFADERPELIADFGQDDCFATETHPEGLRYGERKHPPGTEFHGQDAGDDAPDDDAPVICMN